MNGTSLAAERSDFRSVSTRVVMAVADTLDIDPIDVEQLHNAVDPDALDRLVRHSSDSLDSALRLTFTLDDCAVAVDGSGDIEVTGPGETEFETSPSSVCPPSTETPTSTD